MLSIRGHSQIQSECDRRADVLGLCESVRCRVNQMYSNNVTQPEITGTDINGHKLKNNVDPEQRAIMIIACRD